MKKQLESLQRCQSLEEVHRLYESGKHSTVVELLLLTFRQQQQAPDKHGGGGGKLFQMKKGSLPERHAQLKLLQDSLLNMQDYEVQHKK